MPSHMGAGVLLYCLAGKEPKKPDALKGISRQEAIVGTRETVQLRLCRFSHSCLDVNSHDIMIMYFEE